MTYHQVQINIRTNGRGMTNISSKIQKIVIESNIRTGLLHIFLKHTSASLILCENAAPEVRADLEAFMSGLVIDGDPAYMHRDEGPDDMSAHIRSILTTNDMTIPIVEGQLGLGTWQGVFLWEHRTSPHNRVLTVTMSS